MHFISKYVLSGSFWHIQLQADDIDYLFAFIFSHSNRLLKYKEMLQLNFFNLDKSRTKLFVFQVLIVCVNDNYFVRTA